MALGYELERSHATDQYGHHVRKMFLSQVAPGNILIVFIFSLFLFCFVFFLLEKKTERHSFALLIYEMGYYL